MLAASYSAFARTFAFGASAPTRRKSSTAPVASPAACLLRPACRSRPRCAPRSPADPGSFGGEIALARARRPLRLRRSGRDRTASAPARRRRALVAAIDRRLALQDLLRHFDHASNSFSANSSSSALVSTRADSGVLGEAGREHQRAFDALAMPQRLRLAAERRLVLLVGDQRGVARRRRLRVQRIVVRRALVLARRFGEAAGLEQHFGEQVTRRGRFGILRERIQHRAIPARRRRVVLGLLALLRLRVVVLGEILLRWSSAARRLRAHRQQCASARTPSRTRSARRTPACLRAPATRTRPSDTPRSCASAATARSDRPGGAWRTPRTPAQRPDNAPCSMYRLPRPS